MDHERHSVTLFTDTNSRLTLASDTTDSYVLSILSRSTPRRGIYMYIFTAETRVKAGCCVSISVFFSLSFSRSCRTRRRLIVANGPSSWRHERGNGIKPRRAARDLLIVATSCRGAARRRASGRDSNSSQDSSYIMCVHRVRASLLLPLLSLSICFYSFLSATINLFVACLFARISNRKLSRACKTSPWRSSCNLYRARDPCGGPFHYDTSLTNNDCFYYNSFHRSRANIDAVLLDQTIH